MLKSYFLVALRTLRKQPGYTCINVLGLALGLACCLIIFLFVYEEYTFDAFHQKADDLYRLYNVEARPEGTRIYAGMPMPLGPALQADVAAVRHTVRVLDGGGTVQVDEARFGENILFADAAFFEVFSFPLVQGDPATALTDLQSVVLTEAQARKYFGETPALGQTLRIRIGPDFEDFLVTGVAAALPEASSIRFRMVVRFEKHPFYPQDGDNWDSFNHQVYAELMPGTDPATVETHLVDFSRTYLGDLTSHLNRLMGLDPETGDAYQLRLQPIRAMHLDARIPEGRSSNPLFSWILGIIALMVLGSGCINFVNLSTGQAATRLKEVGVRKVVGAGRRQLMGQFWGETLLLCLLALVLGVGLAELGLPHFNAFLRRDLSLDLGGNGPLWVALPALLLLTALLAGSYPALYLTRFQPSDILKGYPQHRGKGPFRNGLIVFQFALAFLLVMSMLTMTRQLDYLRTQDPGFDQEQVVVVPVSASEQDDAFVEVYKQQLQSVAGVVGVTAASNALGQGPSGGRSTSIITFTHEDTDIPAHVVRIDPDYLATLGLGLVWGRSFSADLPGDRQAILINETLARRLAIEPGESFPLTGFSIEHGVTPTVIGVVRDFNFEALRQPIAPLVMHMDASVPFTRLFIRIRPENVPATLAAVETHWKALTPDHTFRHSFLDEDVDRQYTQEVRQIQVAGVATILAMLIACFGLLGLAVLTSVRRTKEIGVRKVLGASVAGLVLLLSKDFLRWVALAFMLAAPLAWFNMDLWLSQFAYQIEMSWQTFLTAGLSVLLVAVLTVSYQAVKAALANPVKSLRYE